jgi:NAD(P)-dependent dehydrogenase (short-subunit alcohol dehydrogenase family)
MAGLDAHPQVSLQTLDVTVEEDVHRVVNLIVAEAGQIDIVVNNGTVVRVRGGSCLTIIFTTYAAGLMGVGTYRLCAHSHRLNNRDNRTVNVSTCAR